MGERDIYEKKGYRSGHIGFGLRPAVVVVDFQRAFTDANSPFGTSEHIRQALDRTKDLLAAARRAKAPVIFTVVAYREDKMDMGLWPAKVSRLAQVLLNSPWAQIDPALALEPTDLVLVKKMPSAFFATDLATILIQQKVDTLVIAGCTTSGCVRATVVDAFSYGFRPIVVRDCCGDQSVQPHEANLFDIENRYADVVTCDDVTKYFAKRFELQG
jgi:maleamate amidohydrolase